MRLPKTLRTLRNEASAEIRVIRDFAKEVDERLADDRVDKATSQKFQKEDVAALRALANLLTESVKNAEGGKKVALKVETTPRVMDFFLKAYYPVRKRTFLAEMTLSYLVSHVEAFVRDYLFLLLVANPVMLRSSATLTYAEITSHKSMAALRRDLAHREMENLGHGGIDDIGMYFNRRLSIDLSKFEHWAGLRENCYRRNLIVHNRGRVNQIYRAKVGYAGKEAQLSTNMQYVLEAVERALAFVAYVDEQIQGKVGQVRRKAKSQVDG